VLDLDALNFDKQAGLVTVVAQDATTGAVLMVAHADREALERTLETGEMHYRSRSRGLWHKGATSGNVQRVAALAADCDGDAVLALVRPAGPACHTGAVSCFGGAALGAGALSALDATIAARAETGAGDEAGSSPEAGSGAGFGADARMNAGTGARGAPPEHHDASDAAAGHHPNVADRIVPPPTAPVPPSSAPPSYTRRLLVDRNLRLKKLGEEAAELVLACADGDRPRAAEEAADLVYHTLVALRAVGLTLDDVRRVLAERAASGR
jgi:phosphoribosyl-ATP pyrophosphohydrolase/phosphoribosyl-AMP cyclohydrolase